MGRATLAAAATVVLVGAVAGALATRSSPDAPVPRGPLNVTGASLTPRTHAFGDEVRAQVDVMLDSKRVDPYDVRLVPDFRPYQQAAPLELSRRHVGRVVHLSYEFRLSCLTLACVPLSEPAIKETRSFHFKPALVVYHARAAQRRTKVFWPELHTVTQLTARELPHAGEPIGPRVEAIPVLDEPAYRMPPAFVRAGLFGLALLLAAVGVFALQPYLRRRQPVVVVEPEPTGPELTPLQRALAGLQWARAHGAPREQRKALELLSEELEHADEGELAEEARALAWSPAPPGFSETEALAERVEAVVEKLDAVAT